MFDTKIKTENMFDKKRYSIESREKVRAGEGRKGVPVSQEAYMLILP